MSASEVDVGSAVLAVLGFAQQDKLHQQGSIPFMGPSACFVFTYVHTHSAVR